MGFSLGSLNPFANTGINKKISNTVQSVAVIAGDYFVPGSSLLTKNIASVGSQKQLNTTVGKAHQFGASAVGLGIGSSYTGLAPSKVGKAMQIGFDKGVAKIGSGAASVATGVASLFGAGATGAGDMTAPELVGSFADSLAARNNNVQSAGDVSPTQNETVKTDANTITLLLGAAGLLFVILKK